MSAPVQAILGFSRTVSDLAATETFYRDGLGFSRIAPPAPVPTAHRAAMGLDGGTAMQLRMRLGAQAVTFLALDPPGRPYPAEPLATDPFFQHLAIPVRDLAAAMEILGWLAPIPISRGGPQRLPPASGSVTAYKFRDPDGHPLELLFFPGGEPAERWRAAPGLFLGIDHSAITVTDLDATLALLTGVLGLRLAARGLNIGPEQASLDGLDDPQVDVLALEPPIPAPHMELLHYRQPAWHRPMPAPFGPRDRATTRFVFSVLDPAIVRQRVSAAGFSLRCRTTVQQPTPPGRTGTECCLCGLCPEPTGETRSARLPDPVHDPVERRVGGNQRMPVIKERSSSPGSVSSMASSRSGPRPSASRGRMPSRKGPVCIATIRAIATSPRDRTTSSPCAAASISRDR